MKRQQLISLIIAQAINLGFIFIGVKNILTFDKDTSSAQVVSAFIGLIIFSVFFIYVIRKLLKNSFLS